MPRSEVRDVFESRNIPLTESQAALFDRFADSFLAYNSHTNLSAIRDREGVLEKHFADSAELVRFEEIPHRILDIGTGGGFPGIPLKILRPDTEFVLLDSVSKKTKACDSFIADLGLSSIRTVWGRAEEIAKDPGMAGGFGLVVSRATAYLPQILGWAAPFVARGGRIALYKLPSETELADGVPVAEKLGLTLVREHGYSLAGQDRRILVFQRK